MPSEEYDDENYDEEGEELGGDDAQSGFSAFFQEQ